MVGTREDRPGTARNYGIDAGCIKQCCTLSLQEEYEGDTAYFAFRLGSIQPAYLSSMCDLVQCMKIFIPMFKD